MEISESDITRLLHDLELGHNQGLDALLPLVHDRIKALASRQLSQYPRSSTLSPTVLVNEAYLKIRDASSTRWENREHFFAVVAVVLRRMIIDYARASQAKKRGGDSRAVSEAELADSGIERFTQDRSETLLTLDAALDRLAEIDPRASRIVELKFFGGFTAREIAEAMSTSEMTVKRDWRFARAWLKRAMDA